MVLSRSLRACYPNLCVLSESLRACYPSPCVLPYVLSELVYSFQDQHTGAGSRFALLSVGALAKKGVCVSLMSMMSHRPGNPTPIPIPETHLASEITRLPANLFLSFLPSCLLGFDLPSARGLVVRAPIVASYRLKLAMVVSIQGAKALIRSAWAWRLRQ